MVGFTALVIGGLIATVATLVGSEDGSIVVPGETLPPTVAINDIPYTTTSSTLRSTTNTTTSTTRTTSATVS